MEEPHGDVIPVKVALRCRPFIEKERNEACQNCVNVKEQLGQAHCDGDDKVFTYDYTFGPLTCQPDVYMTCIRPIVPKLFTGQNITILAYGQTGSGKTYTMGTEAVAHSSTMAEDECGIIPRIVDEIFDTIESRKETMEVSVKLTFVEVYKDDVLDLLAGKRVLQVRLLANDVLIPDQKEVSARTAGDVLGYLQEGCKSRTKGETAMNASSSRSHAIFSILLHITDLTDQTKSMSAKCHLVDLAGSERLAKTKAVGDRKKEGIAINTGLFHLGKVIEALAEAKPAKYISYRDDRLTSLLRDSLGGNSHTLFIACVSPADSNYEETKNTLRYAEKASKIKNKPIVNMDPIAAEIARLKRENLALRLRVAELEGSSIPGQNRALERAISGSDKHPAEGEFDDGRHEKEQTVHEMQCDKCELVQQENKIITDQYTLVVDARANALVALEKRDEMLDKIRAVLADGETKESAEARIRAIEELISPPDSDETDEDADPTRADFDLPADFESNYREQQHNLNDQLEALNRQIAEKENLAKLNAENEANLAAVRAKYEADKQQLEVKIKEIEAERAELLQQMRSVQNSSKVSEQRRKRLQEVEAHLKETQSKIRDLVKMARLKESADQTIVKLRGEISAMKQAKVKLMRQIEGENKKFKQYKQQKDREICGLKAKGKRQEFAALRDKRALEKQMSVYRQKYEQAMHLSKRLKEQQQKRIEIDQSASTTGIAPRTAKQISAWLEREIDIEVSAEEARQAKRELIEQRKELAHRKTQLEQELAHPPPSRKKLAVGRGESVSTDSEAMLSAQEVEELKRDIALRNDQIQQLQATISQTENDSNSEQRWAKLLSLPQCRFALKELYAKLISSQMEFVRLKREHRELIASTMESKKDYSAARESIGRVNELERRLYACEKQYQEKVAYFLRVVLGQQQGTIDSNQLSQELRSELGKLEKVETLAEQLQASEMRQDQMEKELLTARQPSNSSEGSHNANGQNGRRKFFKEPRKGMKRVTSKAKVSKMESACDSSQGSSNENEGNLRRTRSSRDIKPVHRLQFGQAQPFALAAPAADTSLDGTFRVEVETSQTSDDSTKDPDYRETPVEKQLKSRLTVLVDKPVFGSAAPSDNTFVQPTDDTTTRSLQNQHRCSCKLSKCASAVCGCRKAGATCSANCKCALDLCKNRTVQENDEEEESLLQQPKKPSDPDESRYLRGGLMAMDVSRVGRTPGGKFFKSPLKPVFVDTPSSFYSGTVAHSTPKFM